MVLGTIGAFLLMRSYGERLVAPLAPPAAVADVNAQSAQVLVPVLVALAAVIITGQLLAKGFAYLRQPPVIGEVVAGILLGPSLLGPELSGWLLPLAVAPFLGLIAQLGVILYMFLVGLELNTGRLTHRVHATVATSHASILVPFLLGTLLALAPYPRLSHRDVPFTSFALFMGVAMAITAFPVLARILTDRALARTELGAIALGCAAVDDVTAWCLLAFVVGIARAEVGEGLLVTAGHSATSPACCCSPGPCCAGSPRGGPRTRCHAARWPGSSWRCSCPRSAPRSLASTPSSAPSCSGRLFRRRASSPGP